MRSAIIPTLLAATLVVLGASPALADKPETRAVIPFEFEFGPVENPCTGQETMLKVMFEQDLHALPSIESFDSGDFTHANYTITGQAVGVDDGYATEWKPFARGVINQDGDHYVGSAAENVMFYGDDGGKYRVRRPFKLVVTRGEVKVSSEADDAVCVRQPAG